MDTYANQFLRDHEMVAPPRQTKSNDVIVPIPQPPAEEVAPQTFIRPENHLHNETAPMNFSNPRNLMVDDDEADKYRRRLPPNKRNHGSFR